VTDPQSLHEGYISDRNPTEHFFYQDHGGGHTRKRSDAAWTFLGIGLPFFFSFSPLSSFPHRRMPISRWLTLHVSKWLTSEDDCILHEPSIDDKPGCPSGLYLGNKTMVTNIILRVRYPRGYAWNPPMFLQTNEPAPLYALPCQGTTDARSARPGLCNRAHAEFTVAWASSATQARGAGFQRPKSFVMFPQSLHRLVQAGPKDRSQETWEILEATGLMHLPRTEWKPIYVP
jgi:hypothetical protein